MSFAENLKILRKEKYLSQEQLAEIMDVSRQAVSKWEQGSGYPETEKLIELAKKLDVSLDVLLLDKTPVSDTKTETAVALSEKGLTVPTESAIYIQNEDILVRCYKFFISPVAFPAKREPKFALVGVDGAWLFEDRQNHLGWYAEKEDVQKEVAAIAEAVKSGKRTYQLQYNCKVKNGFFSSKIVE
ncbi:MAG: helix-turn-helix domain-containing protein [Oscillospiraceae bacterium]|nr:helix-turn-helix domain-containing protein [Oscillospiraceae bacterium]